MTTHSEMNAIRFDNERISRSGSGSPSLRTSPLRFSQTAVRPAAFAPATSVVRLSPTCHTFSRSTGSLLRAKRKMDASGFAMPTSPDMTTTSNQSSPARLHCLPRPAEPLPILADPRRSYRKRGRSILEGDCHRAAFHPSRRAEPELSETTGAKLLLPN